MKIYICKKELKTSNDYIQNITYFKGKKYDVVKLNGINSYYVFFNSLDGRIIKEKDFKKHFETIVESRSRKLKNLK